MTRRTQRGQVLPIAAVAILVLCAVAGLAIDASRDYLNKRDAQNAADFAVLAAAKQMTLNSSLAGPVSAGSSTVAAAHDYAASNGFGTVYSTACDSPGAGTFTTTWFDRSGFACNATSGFTTKVTFNSPAVPMAGNPLPLACTGAGQFSCVQVTITSRVAELFTAVLGVSYSYVTVAATAQAVLAANTFNAPPPDALVIYQPQSGCEPGQQCFDETKPAARALLSCSGTNNGVANNCPTFWARAGTSPKIFGYDGSVLAPPGDYVAVQSNGDMVVQSPTTICDPYNGRACAAGAATGVNGFSIPTGANLYCASISGTGGPCTTSGQSSLSTLYGNQVVWQQPIKWFPNVDTSQLRNCGALVLNGQAVSGPCANSGDPYTIEPGIYSYIVINHGDYEFAAGLFDITRTAPVNSATASCTGTGCLGAAYTANGIDHSQETATDFDLCGTGQPGAGTPTACPGLTAGIWIGHGGGQYGAFVGPQPGSCVSGVAGSNGGGGDPTIVSASGSVFRFESTSGGFVSTHEVKAVSLAGAGVGSLASVGGSPLLFDLENNGFIHLDSSTPPRRGSTGPPPNTVSGIIYQDANAAGGGVEFDPSMAGYNVSGQELPAIQGQILAYTVTAFGASGGTLNFVNGYGGGAVPGIGTSGRNENSIISGVTLTATPGKPGYSTLTVGYTDEWAMDAYDVYIKVNNGNPIFFSEGIWSSSPAPGSPLPPPGNNPGDASPAYPDPSAPGHFTQAFGSSPADWIYTLPGASGDTIEVNGNWTWGHENTISGAQTQNNTAQLIYTFSNPVGSYLNVTVFLLDGDRCGDYAYANYTFRSTGGPGPGQQSIGSVTLVQ